MRKNPYTLFLLLILLIFSPGMTAGDLQDIPDYIKNAPDEKQYPDTDGLILKQEIELELLADGIINRRYLTATKVLREYALRAGAGDPKVVFEPGVRPLNIIQSVTYMADGTAVKTEENGFNEITPFELEHLPDYTNIRQMIVTFLGVERHATMVLEYEINNSEPSPQPFWGEIFLQSDKPILSQKISISMPEGLELSYHTFGFTQSPKIEDLPDGGMKYIFERRNVPPVNTAEQSRRREYLDRLVYAMFSDWHKARQFLRGPIVMAMNTSPELREKVIALTEDAGTAEEKIDAIHTFVVDHIRTINWPLDDFSFMSRSATETYSSGAGHPLDKAVLLSAMLREVAMDGQIFFASPSLRFAPNVASPVQVDDIWVRVQAGGEKYDLHPSAHQDDRNAFTLGGKAVLTIQGGKITPEIMPLSSPDQSVRRLSGDLSVQGPAGALKLAGTFHVDLTGHANPALSLSTQEKDIREMAEAIAKHFGGELETFSLSRLSKERTLFTMSFVDGQAAAEGKYPASLRLPDPPGHQDLLGLELYRKTRETPLLLPPPFTEITDTTIAVPSDLKVVLQPGACKIENKAGHFSLEVKDEDHLLKIKRRLVSKAVRIEPEDYAMLRDIFVHAAPEKNNVVLFEAE